MLRKYNINQKENLFYLSKMDIEAETQNLLMQYCPDCLERPTAIPIENLIEDLEITIEPQNLSEDHSVYGAFIFNKGLVKIFDGSGNYLEKHYDDKTILIDKKIYNIYGGITFFTLGHELGHYYLQYSLKHVDKNQMTIFNYMNEDEKAKYFLDTSKILNESLDSKNEPYKFSFMEWQANYFSSSILIPKKTLDLKLKEENKGFRKLQFYSTLKNVSENEYEEIIKNLSDTFNVSKLAMTNRLKTLEYI